MSNGSKTGGDWEHFLTCRHHISNLEDTLASSLPNAWEHSKNINVNNVL